MNKKLYNKILEYTKTLNGREVMTECVDLVLSLKDDPERLRREVGGLFPFASTPEGYNFWYNIYCTPGSLKNKKCSTL